MRLCIAGGAAPHLVVVGPCRLTGSLRLGSVHALLLEVAVAAPLRCATGDDAGPLGVVLLVLSGVVGLLRVGLLGVGRGRDGRGHGRDRLGLLVEVAAAGVTEVLDRHEDERRSEEAVRKR